MLSFASLATSDLNRLDSRRTPDWTGLVDHRLCISLDGVAIYSGLHREIPGNGVGQQELNIPGLQEQEAKRVNKPVVELPVSGSDGESIAHAATHSMTARPSANRWRISWRTRRPAQPAAMSPCATAPVSSVSTAARASAVPELGQAVRKKRLNWSPKQMNQRDVSGVNGYNLRSWSASSKSWLSLLMGMRGPRGTSTTPTSSIVDREEPDPLHPAAHQPSRFPAASGGDAKRQGSHQHLRKNCLGKFR